LITVDTCFLYGCVTYAYILCALPHVETLQTILKVRCRVHKRKICPDILDADTSGYLDVEELAHLLVGWGLPASESKNLTKELDLNGNGELDCKEFEKQLKPVWTCMVVLYGEIDPVS